MSERAAGTSEEATESTPLLPEKCHGNKPQVPVLRARIVSALVPVFALSATPPLESMMAQYVFNRLADDAGYTNVSRYHGGDFKNNSDPDVRMADEIQIQATDFLMYLGIVEAIPAFFNCLLIGSYSDYLGRRPLLMIPLFTNMAKMIIITVIIKLKLNISFLYLAYGIHGLAGSWFSMMLALFSLTADISSTTQSRTFWIYFVACSEGTMAALANIGNGYLISYLGFTYASLLLAIMSFISFIVPFLLLPETFLNRPRQRQLNPLRHIRRIFGFYFFDGSNQRQKTFRVCLLSFVAAVGALINISSMETLYQLHEPFCWTSEEIGYYQALRTAGAYCLGAFWLNGLQRCMEPGMIALIGTLFQAAMYIFEAFIWAPWQFYLVPIIGIPSTGILSISRATLSLLAGPDGQGALFSSIAVVDAFCVIISVATCNKMYGATVDVMPGAVYLMYASFSLLTCLTFIVYFYVREPPSSHEMEFYVEKPDIQKLETSSKC